MNRPLCSLSILLGLLTALFMLFTGCDSGDDDDNDAVDDDTADDDTADDDTADDDTADDDTVDDDTADDDTTDIYEDACTNYAASELVSWQPQSDAATLRAKFFNFDPESEDALLLDGAGLHLRVPTGNSGGCWLNLPAGHYTGTLSIGEVDQDTLEFDLAENTVSMVVSVNHEVNGPDMVFLPVDVTTPEGQWSFNVLSFAQDIKPNAIDVYLWPTGTTTEDYRTVTPEKIASNVAYGDSVAVDVTPAFSPYGKKDTIVPSLVYALISAGTALDLDTVVAEFFMPCYSSVEDPTFSVEILFGTCSDESTEDDDPNGFCYGNSGNSGTSLFYPGEMCF